MTPETRKTLETCATIAKAIEGDANLEVNFSSNGSIQIHWCGVIQVNGTPAQPAKAVRLLKQLSALGARDC